MRMHVFAHVWNSIHYLVSLYWQVARALQYSHRKVCAVRCREFHVTVQVYTSLHAKLGEPIILFQYCTIFLPLLLYSSASSSAWFDVCVSVQLNVWHYIGYTHTHISGTSGRASSIKRLMCVVRRRQNDLQLFIVQREKRRRNEWRANVLFIWLRCCYCRIAAVCRRE